MATLTADDKAKGKRIIAQFFRTMSGVQKTLLTLFDKDGYEGVFKLQNMLYPEHISPINSIDTLRKGLSMILQHIYGMPVEDKEGYFQDIVKCKTSKQVVRKEKETLVNYFYSDFSILKDTLRGMMVEDRDFRVVNAFCKHFLKESAEDVSDMRGFKNQIRNIREVIGEQMSSGISEQEMVDMLQEKKAVADAQFPPQSAVENDVSQGGPGVAPDDQAEEKRRIITEALGGEKYAAIRNVLLENAVADPNFSTFQRYLDNILAPSGRLITDNLDSFSQGVQKIKEFRDALEKELTS